VRVNNTHNRIYEWINFYNPDADTIFYWFFCR
jgi:hypothetical protein